MAITGRPPSAQSRNRNPKAYDWTTIEAVPYAGPSPDLPRRGRARWHPQTTAWWEAVRHMPHASLWTETDWWFAAETAVLVDEFWRGESARAAEMRLRSARLGLTYEDRLKLRIRYVAPQSDQAAAGVDAAVVTRLSDRRRRLAEDT